MIKKKKNYDNLLLCYINRRMRKNHIIINKPYYDSVLLVLNR